VLTIDIDDKSLKDILGNLYYPASPYEFSVTPADVRGQVYEQFLGKDTRFAQAARLCWLCWSLTSRTVPLSC